MSDTQRLTIPWTQVGAVLAVLAFLGTGLLIE
jgi:hypothetical protein